MQQAFPCPKCGAQIPVGQQLCNTCGQRFEYRCHHCGAATRDLSGFCTNCGGKLYQQTHLTKPSANKVKEARQKERARRERMVPQPAGQIGRYLIFIATIIFIGAILYTIGTGLQGQTSNWFGSSFIFGGASPPSTPPSTDAQQQLKPASDSPHYTMDQVIAAAKKISPYCRVPTRRTG